MDIITGSMSIGANVNALFDSAHGGDVGSAVVRLEVLDMSMAPSLLAATPATMGLETLFLVLCNEMSLSKVG